METKTLLAFSTNGLFLFLAVLILSVSLNFGTAHAAT